VDRRSIDAPTPAAPTSYSPPLAATDDLRGAVSAFEKALLEGRAPTGRGGFGMGLSGLQEELLRAPLRALATWKTLRENDLAAQQASSNIERILLQSKDHAALAAEWENRATAVDVDDREGLLLRLAKLYEEQLRDISKSVLTYEALLIENPTSEIAIDALTRLYDVQGQYRDVARVLAQKFELAQDNDERRAVAFALAQVHEHRLNDPGQAIVLMEDLREQASDHEVIDELLRLYALQEQWSSYLVTMESKIELAVSPSERAEWMTHTAEVCLHKLNDSYRAFELASGALELDRDAVEATAVLLQCAGEENLAQEVVPVLLKHYRIIADLPGERLMLERTLGLATGDAKNHAADELCEFLVQKQGDLYAGFPVG